MRIKPKEQIKSDLQTGMAAAKLTNWNAGSVIGTIKNVIADTVDNLYSYGIDVMQQSCVQTASDAFLDARASEWGLTRLAGAKARRKVTLFRSRGIGNVVIPENAIVQSPTDCNGVRYRFYVLDALTLVDGQTEATAEVEAENIGAGYNLVANSVTALGSQFSGIDGVRDDLSDTERIVSEGADAESDDRLRVRIFGAFSALGRGTVTYYKSLPMNDVRVAACWVDANGPRGEGSIDLVVQSTTGAPSEALLTDLRDTIIGTAENDYQDGLRMAGDDVWVRGIATLDVNIAATIWYRTGFSPAAIESTIRNGLAVFFGASRDEYGNFEWWPQIIQQGDALSMSQIWEIVMRPDGVSKCTALVVTVPSLGTTYDRATEDVPLPTATVPALNTLTITFHLQS
jgi:uncharacterized phage protein gp47/JayE